MYDLLCIYYYARIVGRHNSKSTYILYKEYISKDKIPPMEDHRIQSITFEEARRLFSKQRVILWKRIGWAKAFDISNDSDVSHYTITFKNEQVELIEKGSKLLVGGWTKLGLIEAMLNLIPRTVQNTILIISIIISYIVGRATS